jgi:Trp operon repressor
MRVSKNRLSPKLTKELYTTLCRVLAGAQTREEVEAILLELLSDTEKIALMKRVGIASALSRRESYDVIHKKLNVSSATIAAIQERMDQPGWKKIVEEVKLQAEAETLVQKLRKLFPFW